MPAKIKQIWSSDFFRSSTIVFAANLFSGLLNYVLVVLVSRRLGAEYSLWTALTGVITILSTIFAGYSFELNKVFAKLSHQDRPKVLASFQIYQHKLQKYVLFGLLISPLLAFVFDLAFGIGNWGIVLLMVIQLLGSFYAIIGIQYLIGNGENLKFGLATFASALVKLISTLFFLEIGLKLWALPLGLLSQTALSFILAEIMIFYKNPKTKTYIKNLGDFSIKKLFFGSFKSTFYLFLLITLFNITPVISQRILPNEEKDFFAVLFSFGQIIHFGATAFAASVVTHGTKNDGYKVLKQALGIVSVLSAAIGLLFFVAGDFMLKLFKRTGFGESLNYILYFSLFVFAYNLTFMVIQYLLSQSKFNLLKVVPFFLIFQVLMGYFATQTLASIFKVESLFVFVTINLLSMFTLVLMLLWQVRGSSRKTISV